MFASPFYTACWGSIEQWGVGAKQIAVTPAVFTQADFNGTSAGAAEAKGFLTQYALNEPVSLLPLGSKADMFTG